jgi:secretion/DNA translocation related CpaE-like protein
MPISPQPARPLAITADTELLDDLLRLAAAGGVELEVAADPAAARRRFAPAPMVLIGVDVAEACHLARLPRRPGVVLVGRSADGEPRWDLANLLSAAHVVLLPKAEPWLVDRFVDIAGAADRQARVVAVIGGRGGAGASVLAAGLAMNAADDGYRTLLVDADPLGGGVDLLLGMESTRGVRWPSLRDTDGRLDPPALVEALPRQRELLVLSWDRGDYVAIPPGAMEAAMAAGRQGRDLVVIDLPRRLDTAATIALASADRVLLVVPAELRATAAAGRVVAAVVPHCPSLSVVVRGPTPGRLSAADISKSLRLPLAGCLRPEPKLAAAVERGDGATRLSRGPIGTLCRRLVADVLGVSGQAAAA